MSDQGLPSLMSVLILSGMSRKPEIIRWHIYRFAKTPKYVGQVLAPDNDPEAAIKQAIKDFDIQDPTTQKKLNPVPVRAR